MPLLYRWDTLVVIQGYINGIARVFQSFIYYVFITSFTVFIFVLYMPGRNYVIFLKSYLLQLFLSSFEGLLIQVSRQWLRQYHM